MSRKTGSIDEDPQLILEPDRTVRNVFDPHICSLTIEAKTNDPTDGYKLALSVFFGSERIELETDKDTTLEFQFEIFAAEVIVDPVYCNFDNEFERDRSFMVPVVPGTKGLDGEGQESWRVKVATGELLDSIGLPSAILNMGNHAV